MVGLANRCPHSVRSCKEYQNLNAFFAVVMGLSHMACSRLTQTWDKLPSKFRKLFAEFEALIDPIRNHRAYRYSSHAFRPPPPINEGGD